LCPIKDPTSYNKNTSVKRRFDHNGQDYNGSYCNSYDDTITLLLSMMMVDGCPVVNSVNGSCCEIKELNFF